MGTIIHPSRLKTDNEEIKSCREKTKSGEEAANDQKKRISGANGMAKSENSVKVSALRR